MKSTCIVVCLAVLIGVGSGLRCYHCEAQTIHSCRKGSPQVKIMSCGLEHSEFFRFCLQKVVIDKQTKKANVTLGCDLIGRDAVLRIIPQCQLDESRYELKQCSICLTDLCSFFDSTGATLPNVLVHMLSFFASFLSAKCLLQ